MAINEKQKRFVEEYLLDMNAAKAAIRAGYSAKTAQRASEIGYQLLQKTPVQEYLAERQKQLAESAEITPEMVLKELAKIGFADIRNAVKWSPTMDEQVVDDVVVKTNGVLLIDSDKLDDATAAAIAEISQTQQGIKIKMHDKKGALVDIGRHLGMFVDRKEITGKDGGPVELVQSSKSWLSEIINASKS